MVAIFGGGLGLLYTQRTSSSALKRDLGVKIDAATAKRGEELGLKMHTILTGLKIECASTQPTGLGSSRVMLQAPSREHPTMQRGMTQIKHRTALGQCSQPSSPSVFGGGRVFEEGALSGEGYRGGHSTVDVLSLYLA